MKGNWRFICAAFLMVALALFRPTYCAADQHKQSSVVEDNEFAEFEVAGEDTMMNEEKLAPTETTAQQQEKAPHGMGDGEEHNKASEVKENFEFIAQDDAGEDDEEFEGYDTVESKDPAGKGVDEDPNKPVDIKPLTFSDIPSHFRSNWSSYQVEAVAVIVILLYVASYFYGKSCNQSLAQEWFARNQAQLEQQFSLVGDDGVTQEPGGGHMFKETDCSFAVWSTGRVGCRGMLSQLRLMKRQDLLGLVTSFLWPRPDRVVHKVELDHGEMDSFVMILGQRKGVLKAVKEMLDLATYATERKVNEKFGLPSNFAVFSEMGEVIPAMLDTATVQFIRKFERSLEYIHISDQFSGAKQPDELSKLPETKPILTISYFLCPDADDETDATVLNFTFHLIERLRRYRLSREAKQKADKKRRNVEESFIRSTHQQRQEQAMARREEKTRERKQRVLEEENPERQKQLEKMEKKREAKLKAPKIKQLKVK